MSECKGIKSDGTPCGNAALTDSEYCRHHQPDLQAELALAQKEISDKPYVKQIGRYISPQGIFHENAWPVWAVDEYLNTWRKAGYKLHSAFPFDRNPDGFGIFYVLVLDE